LTLTEEEEALLPLAQDVIRRFDALPDADAVGIATGESTHRLFDRHAMLPAVADPAPPR
jgi:hypothetical protein